jgi:uncharacterized protein (TIGR00266 family)
MRSHEIEFEIFGDAMQTVEVILDHSETVVAEAGAMNWMGPEIKFETKMGDGSAASRGFLNGVLQMGKRALTGESIFMTHFTNQSISPGRVAFSAPYPGKIIPIDLREVGGEIICQKDAFLCAAKGTELSIAITQRLGAGFFGGEGFILQRLKGDGLAFLHAGGTIVQKELNSEAIFVDSGCIVGFTGSIEYGVQKAGGLKSMFFGGEGLFLASLQGTGTVWLQSLPFSRLADRVLAHAPAANGKSKGESSPLGTLGRLLDGDN